VAALANIKYMLKHRKEIENNTQVMSQYFYTRLTQMQFKYSSEIRIIGLAIAVKFKQKDYAEKIIKKCLAKGVLLSSTDKGFTFFPALNIDLQTAKQGLDILEQCI
jgi:putrescine aminotransferase/taurine--2-oxoglutarate transaminase